VAEGIQVELLWQPDTGELVVTAFDARAGQAVAVPVGPKDARFVYQHPFAAAAIRGLL
jgi:hypothetical protein